jgi:hypothetical protein
MARPDEEAELREISGQRREVSGVDLEALAGAAVGAQVRRLRQRKRAVARGKPGLDRAQSSYKVWNRQPGATGAATMAPEYGCQPVILRPPMTRTVSGSPS